MTDDRQGEGAPQGASRWDPLPQGDYDDGATAFVKLPEGGIDALLASTDSPLAAPGHGYVPPPITVTPATTAGTDPAATGSWAMPAGGVQWPEAGTGPEETGNDRFTYSPGATGQWNFEDAQADGPAPGHDVTGQWSIPVADGDLPDESGEFTTSALVEQWGGNPPATLPGGAAAPWAAQPTEPGGPTQPGQPAQAIGEPWGRPADAHGPADAAPAVSEPPAAPDEAEAPETPEDASQGAVEAPEADGADEGAREAEEAAEGAVAGPDEDAAESSSMTGEEHPLASYVLRVNGADRPVTDAWIGESLLYVLRERLGLAGAKDGCSQGECGACNVQVDGRLVASCLVPAVTAAGAEVRTVEGLAVDGQPSDVQRALARCGAVQCGFCVPGMAMTVHDLLEGNPAPTELETRQALCGNLCRCSGYRGVVEAVKEVVAEREAHSGADAEADPDEARIPHQAGPGAGGVHPSALDPTTPHDQPYGQDGGQA
ncbi:2Fe-2S iron-sulfur cluster-binding protein [Streptomyces cinnabarinus]|uniref:2Fe-2S iron-sulfur cluster-binding protein n=1 Tax=Streptomyces cinnabarinus TaxID=67287 RepID=A0ABY7KG05_9ACTN|nr:2Fe-2S iron-sulfur cluster-binding protein [Streptomyces cinnabarinus]WAZ22072.1 2Fe-2S iron-sulfur cluster-binding protein [Streptomyces cinnabarinus]